MSPTATAKAPAADDEPLFDPYQLGPLHLSNRIVMAPMTRSRAVDGNVPNPLAETYYRQRAGAGLIITEGSQVSPQGQGYIRTPGIHSPEQIAAWRKITAAVRAPGRQDLSAALACRTHLASGFPRRRVAGGTVRDHARRRGLHRTGSEEDGDAARARMRPNFRASSSSSARARRMPRPRVSTASRSMARMAICSINSPAMAPTTEPMLMAVRLRTAFVCRSKSPRPWPRFGARNGSAIASRRTAPTIRCRIPIRARRSRF